MLDRIVLFALLSLAASVLSAEEAEWERFLIPVVASGEPGALASEWFTSHWIQNPTDSEVDVAAPVWTPIWGPQPFFTVLPRDTTQLPLRTAPGFGPGVLVRVPSSEAGVISFHTRVFEASQLQGAVTPDGGTELPTVPESHLQSGMRSLFYFGLSPDVRTHVRSYVLDPEGSPLVHLRVISLRTGEAVGEHTMELIPTLSDGLFSARSPDIRELLRRPRIDQGELFQVTVEAARQELRMWAFATVTDNRKNHVTIVSP